LFFLITCDVDRTGCWWGG